MIRKLPLVRSYRRSHSVVQIECCYCRNRETLTDHGMRKGVELDTRNMHAFRVTVGRAFFLSQVQAPPTPATRCPGGARLACMATA